MNHRGGAALSRDTLCPVQRILFLSLLFSLACDPSGSGTPTRDGGVDGLPSSGDTDGDGISDDDEGRATNVDTDGDGIPDADEAGDSDPLTPPYDSDGDLIPNFRDEDSDGNGIPDADEFTGDTDGDGSPDFYDTDDDNDLATDAVELSGSSPDVDTDADGLVDFKDPDRDDDGIRDGDEQGVDTDADDLFDWADLDSDNDGIPDAEEAGDDDLSTPPVDTDGDLIPDFRDPDSDDDGLSDQEERMRGLDWLSEDSDGDGVSDLIEIGGGTDPLDPAVNPRTEGNFVFVLPWMEDPEPLRDTLEFKTSIQFADVYFVFDKSGSMSAEISALATSVTNTLNDLTCDDSGIACTDDAGCGMDQVCSLSGTCVQDPTTTTCVPSIWSGAGEYESSYRNRRSLQPDPMATSTAIGAISTGGGTEDFYEMVINVANGGGSGCTSDMPGSIGCPEFRPEAVRILVAFTDEDSDGGSRANAVSALTTNGIKFIGVWSGASGSSQRNDMVALANMSGSVNAAGDPLVFNGVDAGVAPVVVNAINEVVQGIPLRVTIAASELDDDDGDALRFIDYLETNTSGTGACTMLDLTEDTDGDTHPDAFPEVLPGTSVCWDVVPHRNDDIQEPGDGPLVYKALLTVSGDGSPLDERTVYFLVPPTVQVPQGPM